MAYEYNTNSEGKFNMIKIMFVCHGNICRSPMAEFVFKDMVKKAGLEKNFYVASSATSNEEIGNPVHHGTKQKLAQFGIQTTGKTAVRFTLGDYAEFDHIIGMDSYNIRNLLRICGGDPDNKIKRLLDYADGGDIADPWYTNNFDETYRDVKKGCLALLEMLTK